MAVLNANYLQEMGRPGVAKVPHPGPHARVRCAARTLLREKIRRGYRKRLPDHAHARRYFSAGGLEALMMQEPTETESKETLDAFADALICHQNGRS
ncbi:MAG: hypothetical protein U0798_04705 [Gemmataceae bacterium]